jgi:hypothetical protein
VTVFSGARQQNFAGAGHMYHTGATFDLKMCQQNLLCNHASSSPPNSGGNGGGCGNDHCKVTEVTMTTTTTADANADADARSSSSLDIKEDRWR